MFPCVRAVDVRSAATAARIAYSSRQRPRRNREVPAGPLLLALCGSACHHGDMPEMRASVPFWQRVPVFLMTAWLLWVMAGPVVKAIMHGQHVSITPPSVFLALFAVVLCYRLTGVSYRARGQELLIRNYLRTRHVPVALIEGLDIGRASGGSLPTVRVLTGAGAVPIDVISVLRFTGPWPTASHMARLEQHRRELAGWIAMAKTQADPGRRSG